MRLGSRKKTASESAKSPDVLEAFNGFSPSAARGLRLVRESPIRAQQTQSTFHPLAQRNAFGRRDARQLIQIVRLSESRDET